MESTTENRPQFPSTGGSSTTSRDFNQAADKVTSAIHSAADQFTGAASEKIGQAKKKAGEIYEQVNQSVNDQYSRAVDYTRENPGKTTLIAFGIGVGVGVLLLSNVRGTRSRRGRVVEPVMNAISTLATELFA